MIVARWPKGELIALALLLTLFGFAIAAQPDSPGKPRLIACATQADQDHAREVMFAGLDHALDDRTKILFETWMRDAAGQPDRARNGIHQGIDAYMHGRKAIKEWGLPVCH